MRFAFGMFMLGQVVAYVSATLIVRRAWKSRSYRRQAFADLSKEFPEDWAERCPACNGKDAK